MEKKVLDIPETMPATRQDWFNYAARYGISNYTIQAVLHFRGRLDFKRLVRAVKLSVNAEPVLGCKFIKREDMPFWKRLANQDSISWCGLEKVPDREKAVQGFLLEELDMDQDPQVLARVFRCGEKDTLCIKLNHACCDGGSAKAYLRLLANLYSHLGRDPALFPEPNVSGIRDQNPIFDTLGIKSPESALGHGLTDSGLGEPEPGWAFPRQQLDESGQPASAGISIIRIPSRDLYSISSHARARGATINDMLLTAFFRALFGIAKPVFGIPMEIQYTVDLRRYLPEGERTAISNLSGIESIRISRMSDESFSSTLERVAGMMKSVKSRCPGIQSALACELIAGTNFSEFLEMNGKEWQKALISGKSSPMLSNFGVISPYPLLFGDMIADDIYMVAPFFHAPAFMLGASTYNGILTLTAGYYETAAGGEDVTRLLKTVADELISCCRL